MVSCNCCSTLTPCKRLRIVREMLDMTVEGMCCLLKVSRPTLHCMEHRRVVLTLGRMARLSEAGIRPEFILFGTGEPFSLSVEAVKLKITQIVQ